MIRLSLFGLIILILNIFALIDLWKSSKPKDQKIIWSIVICLAFGLGVALYYLLGRK